MRYRVLVNDAVKGYLISTPQATRQRFRKAIEYLENGLWDGGLRIKKLHNLSGKVVLEGRVSRSDRLLFTLGREQRTEEPETLIYLWAVTAHDDVDRTARTIAPENAPFLSFTQFETFETVDPDLEALAESCISQEGIEDRIRSETGSVRWFVLDEAEWDRVLLYSKDEFEIFLYLTQEQKRLLDAKPPLFLSGTAGSGKTTLSVYYLLRPALQDARKLFVTYNRRLKNFCESLYGGLLNMRPDANRITPPLFLTFKELCLRILGEEAHRYPPEREVDSLLFPEIFRHHRLSERYDPVLVWEEIRSIIKGAKPQISAAGMRALLKSKLQEEDAARQVQDEILGLERLSVAEKANTIFLRVLGKSLSETAAQIEAVLQKQESAFFRAMQSTVELIEKHEADFSAPLMTLGEYEQMGRKRAPLFVHDRREIYSIAEWYQGKLKTDHRWDEIDLTRAALFGLDTGKFTRPHYDLVCCDEVQDLTDLQLSLILRLPRSPAMLMLAGDPKQIINPSGFRWEDARKLFYDRGLAVPEVHYLTLNFRCAGSIVLLSNALLELKRRLLGIRHDEKLDDWKFQGRPPFLIEGYREEPLLDMLSKTGADRIILTRSNAERDRLKEALHTELVFTIQEAKGLEFKTVLLWKFCGETGTGDLWKKMLDLDTARIHEALIRNEINLLYVGITRAQQTLILYDGPQASAIWTSNLSEHVFTTRSSVQLEESWRSVSTPQEWKRQGDYYQENEHFRAAAECYRNAGNSELMHRASALDCERRGDLAGAAGHWEEIGEYFRAAGAYERAELYQDALLLWEHLQETDRAAECRIRMMEGEKRFAEAAELWEQRSRWDRAKEAWHKAQRPDRLAPLYEREKQFYDAACNYESARLYAKAAEMYRKCKQPEKAAACLESAGNFAEAANLWRASKKTESLLACLKKLGDAQLLAEHYEQQYDWSRALEYYRRSDHPELLEHFKLELRKLPPSRRGMRAIRLTMLGRAAEAAAEWDRLKQWELALEQYRAVENHDGAGRCYLQKKQWLDAASELARGSIESERGFPNLYRCIQNLLNEDRMHGLHRLNTLAGKLYEDRSWEGALLIYRMIGKKSRAADCAAQLNRFRQAAELWAEAGDFQRMTEWFTLAGQYSEGAKAFLDLMEMKQYPASAFQAVEMEELLRSWLASDPDSLDAVVEIMRPQASYFSPQFIMELLEPKGLYDEILLSAGFKLNAFFVDRTAGIERLWLQEARTMEKAGNMQGAGIRYLLLGHKEEAGRCWQTADLNPDNQQCMLEAGVWEKLLQERVRKRDYWGAGVVSMNHGAIDQSVHYFLKSPHPGGGADLLAKDKHYKAALELYVAAANRPRQALMLEKLKRYEEAAKLYLSLGDKKKHEACMKKLAARKTTRPKKK